MAFADALKDYIEQVGCTPKALAEAAGISPSTLSRYLSGDRSPVSSGDADRELASALARLSEGAFDEAEIAATLRRELTGSELDPEDFIANFELLMATLGINNNRLARALGFDPSYISRIRAGQRHPANVALFGEQVAHYVATSCTSSEQIAQIAKLCSCSPQDAMDTDLCEKAVRSYLGSQAEVDPRPSPEEAALSRFLVTLDAFDLNAFLESIHFDDIKVPTVPFQLPTTKTYSGIEEMKQAELDFLKAAVLARSTDDVVFYSDMPIAEMAKDREFTEQIMKGVALLVRKGVTIQNIHDVHRPISELFMGLEGWVPVYMTGHMESHYLPFPTNNAFLHFLRSAGTVACAGEAIAGDQASGRYTVTKSPADVAYYRTRAEQLLALTKPLINTFREHDRKERDAALRKIHSAYGSSTIDVGKGQFDTLEITALPGRYVLISKKSSPQVDFLVEHPALVEALEHFEPSL